VYYFVDHTERLIFSIDNFEIPKLSLWRTMPGITASTHVSKYFFAASACTSNNWHWKQNIGGIGSAQKLNTL
jgi:hypothetical protein